VKKLISYVAFPFVKIKRIFNFYNNSTIVRILTFHNIEKDNFNKFSLQLNYISKNWKFITPRDFNNFLSGDSLEYKKNILLTFDDGFYSQRIVAEKILNPMNIKSIFFIPTDFINLVDLNDQQNFIKNNLEINFSKLKDNDNSYSMNWKDLEFLITNGHTIGAHTKSHRRLSKIFDNTELINEIVKSSDEIENKLGIKVENFAYTFGDLSSINALALNIAKKRFKYIYTGLRGVNTKQIYPWALRRDSITPYDNRLLIDTYLEGFVDFLYHYQIKKYENLF
jgi:peptidoglycan/xylan/chitin deacetylase (PgdA/CDA1 family)